MTEEAGTVITNFGGNVNNFGVFAAPPVQQACTFKP